MEYTAEEQAYRNKLIEEIETMVAQISKPEEAEKPKLRVVK